MNWIVNELARIGAKLSILNVLEGLNSIKHYPPFVLQAAYNRRGLVQCCQTELCYSGSKEQSFDSISNLHDNLFFDDKYYRQQQGISRIFFFILSTEIHSS